MDNIDDNKLNAWHPSSDPHENKKSFWHGLREWIQVIVVALIISLPIRFFIAEPFLVNGASMDSTFASGQFLIVDRLSYRLGEPSRGDIVIFKYPNNPSIYYIKRIIGLPEETVEIKNGKVSIKNANQPDGFQLNEPYIDFIRQSKESLVAKLGHSEYFVMGDNRSESSDSRIWGPLEKNLIIGRPIFRLFPVVTASILPGEYHEQRSTK